MCSSAFAVVSHPDGNSSVLNTSSWVDGSVISSATFAEGVADPGGNTGMAYCLFKDAVGSYWSAAVAFSAESDITACLSNYTFTHANGCVAPAVASQPTAAPPPPVLVSVGTLGTGFALLLLVGGLVSVWQKRNKVHNAK
ncbi:MAG: hypothetical protein VSS75_026485 [Candidatus Parabeggiatoa sp.]|nr:hypothetical protein [Candidatus Parabeggiatoa sp.]